VIGTAASPFPSIRSSRNPGWIAVDDVKAVSGAANGAHDLFLLGDDDLSSGHIRKVQVYTF